MRYSFFHWGLHPWAVYALIGLAMAWFQYNRGGRGLVSDLLQPLIGAAHSGWPGRVVNVLAIVATAIGVGTTLGLGSIKTDAGLEGVFGIPARRNLQLAVTEVGFVL